ncbi:MAG: phosphatase PAP2 family protein [Pseudomonadota bacterium]
MQLTLAPVSAPALWRAIALWLTGLLVLFILDAPLKALVLTLPSWVEAMSQPITRLGKSDWMAVVVLTIALVSAVVWRTAPKAAWRAHGRLALHMAVATFFTVLIAGVLTQVLKHLIGRARPWLFETHGAYSFSPLEMSVSFNSFPSGHASTVGALAILLWWLWPQLWRWWVGGALVIALTRVTTANHFASDIYAGLSLGIVVAAAMLILLLSHGTLPPRASRRWDALAERARRSAMAYTLARTPLRRRDMTLLTRLMAATLIALFVFQTMPGVDLWVSRRFYTAGEGFLLAQSHLLAALREGYFLAMYTALLGALVFWLLSLRLSRAMQIPARLWGFVVMAFIIGPGLVANSLFKEHWGRARPADVIPFGGAHPFTPAALKVDHCASNCSFVSGEGSGIFMLAILVGVLAWRWLRTKPFALAGLASLAVCGAAMRVMTGRHFLSDTVMALLFMALIALALFHWLRIRAAREALSPGSLRADAVTGLRYFIDVLPGDLWRAWQALRAFGVAVVNICRALAPPKAEIKALFLPLRARP